MSRVVDRLSLVYDARGGVVGELAYAIGRARGTQHCALCGLTHGRARERPAWRAFRASLPVPVQAFHLNDRPDDVAGAPEAPRRPSSRTPGATQPCYSAPKQLEGIGRDLETFAAGLDAAVPTAGLAWPSG